MSPLRQASHWNHTPCQACMEKHGLKEPSRSRPQAGPCCFCGGPRPEGLRGRSDTHAVCSGMQAAPKESPGTPKFLEPVMPDEEKVTVAVPKDEIPLAPPAPKRKNKRLVLIDERMLPRPRGRVLKVKPEVPAKVNWEPEEKPAEKAPEPVQEPVSLKPVRSRRAGIDPKTLMDPKKLAEMEVQRAYARRLVEFAKWAIRTKADRGKNEEFSFVTVKRKDKYQYGEAGMHPHRDIGSWTGRKAVRTHLPKRSLFLIDRETHRIVGMVTRWMCGGFGTFTVFTEEANHPLCPKCLSSEEWNKDRLGNLRAAQRRGTLTKMRRKGKA